MKFKLFKLTWDLMPVLIFAWMVLVFVLFCVFLVGALADDITLAMAGFFACMLWAFITNTLASNGRI